MAYPGPLHLPPSVPQRTPPAPGANASPSPSCSFLWEFLSPPIQTVGTYHSGSPPAPSPGLPALQTAWGFLTHGHICPDSVPVGFSRMAGPGGPLSGRGEVSLLSSVRGRTLGNQQLRPHRHYQGCMAGRSSMPATRAPGAWHLFCHEAPLL